MTTLGITGYGGGKLKDLAQHNLHAGDRRHGDRRVAPPGRLPLGHRRHLPPDLRPGRRLRRVRALARPRHCDGRPPAPRHRDRRDEAPARPRPRRRRPARPRTPRVDPEAGARGHPRPDRRGDRPLLRRLGMGRRRIDAVGIGFGGPVDAGAGHGHHVSNQIAGWAGFPIADWVRDDAGHPRASSSRTTPTPPPWARPASARGPGTIAVLYVTDRQRDRRRAGHRRRDLSGLGPRGGRDRPSGRRRPGSTTGRTLEQIASGWSIAATARGPARVHAADSRPRSGLCGGDPARVTAERRRPGRRRGRSRRPRASSTGRRTALGRALAHAVTLLAPRPDHPGRRRLADRRGPLARPDPTTRSTSRVFPPFRGTYDIVPAALGEEVVVHGALALARAPAWLSRLSR